MTRLFWTAIFLGILAPLSALASPKIAVHVESGGWLSETWPLCSAMVSDIYNDQIGTYNGSNGVIGAYYVVSLFAEDTEPGLTGVSFGIAYSPLVLHVVGVDFGRCLPSQKGRQNRTRDTASPESRWASSIPNVQKNIAV